MKKNSSRFCVTCKNSNSIYKCSNCEQNICSVSCSSKHKQTCFFTFTTNQFDISSCHSDIKFLEKFQVKLEQLDNKKLNEKSTFNSLKSTQKKNLSLLRLKESCKKRDIILITAPKEFEIRTANTTKFTKNFKNLLWKVNWICYPNHQLHTDLTISENTKIQDLISRQCLKEKIMNYYSSEKSCVESIEVLLEKKLQTQKIYHKLNKEKSILENLKYKTILEFPTFYICQKSELSNLVIQD